MHPQMHEIAALGMKASAAVPIAAAAWLFQADASGGEMPLPGFSEFAKLGITGVLIFIAILFWWTQYWPWVKQLRAEDDARNDAREKYDREQRAQQWQQLERMSANFAETIKTVAAMAAAQREK